jgi:hypothetical protein
MSALPAEVTEFSPPPAAAHPIAAGSQHRGERRAEQAALRRTRRWWATFSVAILGAMFGLTVGILDVLH